VREKKKKRYRKEWKKKKKKKRKGAMDAKKKVVYFFLIGWHETRDGLFFSRQIFKLYVVFLHKLNNYGHSE